MRVVIGIIVGLLVAWIPAKIVFPIVRSQSGNDAAELAALGIYLVCASIGALSGFARTQEAKRESEKWLAKNAQEGANRAKEDEYQRLMNKIRRERMTCMWCKAPGEFRKDGRRQAATTERRTVARRHYNADGDYVGHSETDYEAPTTEWRDYGHYECSNCGKTWGQETDTDEAAKNAKAWQ